MSRTVRSSVTRAIRSRYGRGAGGLLSQDCADRLAAYADVHSAFRSARGIPAGPTEASLAVAAASAVLRSHVSEGGDRRRCSRSSPTRSASS